MVAELSAGSSDLHGHSLREVIEPSPLQNDMLSILCGVGYDIPIVALYEVLKGSTSHTGVSGRKMQQYVGAHVSALNRKLENAKCNYRVRPGSKRRTYALVQPK